MADSKGEQAFIDGTHPALSRDAAGMEEMRARSPTRSDSDSGSSATKKEEDVDSISDIPLNKTNKSTGATNTGPKGVLYDYNSRSNTGNTGPKGVLADYEGEKLAAKTNELTFDPEPVGDSEDEHVLAWRKKRLAELQGSGERQQLAKVTKRFGHLREIGLDQFVTAVEDENPTIPVVIHLYHPGLNACYELNQQLSTIARSFPYTKFLRALASELDFAANSQEDTLPTLLIYRAGDLETSLVRVDQEWGNGTREEVIELLRRNKAIWGNPVERIATGALREDDSDA